MRGCSSQSLSERLGRQPDLLKSRKTRLPTCRLFRADHLRGMTGGRPPDVAGLSLDEKAVWAHTYSSAYKWAWTAASSASMLTRRLEIRGDVVGRSSGLPLLPEEVAMAAVHEEGSRFKAAHDTSPRAPSMIATNAVVSQLSLPSLPYMALVGVPAPAPSPPARISICLPPALPRFPLVLIPNALPVGRGRVRLSGVCIGLWCGCPNITKRPRTLWARGMPQSSRGAVCRRNSGGLLLRRGHSRGNLGAEWTLAQDARGAHEGQHWLLSVWRGSRLEAGECDAWRSSAKVSKPACRNLQQGRSGIGDGARHQSRLRSSPSRAGQGVSGAARTGAQVAGWSGGHGWHVVGAISHSFYTSLVILLFLAFFRDTCRAATRAL